MSSYVIIKTNKKFPEGNKNTDFGLLRAGSIMVIFIVTKFNMVVPYTRRDENGENSFQPKSSG